MPDYHYLPAADEKKHRIERNQRCRKVGNRD
jgi:hypothetical protein